MTAPSCRLTWLGHASVLIDLDGVRLVTDPLLTGRVGHLRRMVPAPPLPAGVDAALVSHLHRDHLHRRSLRRLGAARVVAPRGAGALLEAVPAQLTEVVPGDRVAVGPLAVEAVHAEHDGRRRPGGPRAPALGYVVRGSLAVYFAGDTAPFPAMADLAAPPLDVALLPIWGWGPTLGPGHMDPEEAARALAVLRPRLAVPIHWATYAPAWAARRSPPRFLTEPGGEFARHAARLAPGVEVALLAPGESVRIDRP